MEHRSVMVPEVIQFLVPPPESRPAASSPPLWWADLTLGGGGHTEALLQATSPAGRVLGMDRDAEALRYAQQRLSGFGERVLLVQGNFADIGCVIREHRIPLLAGIVMDLGVSSFQLEDGARGFSFQQSGPLDMRMDSRQSKTAADWINHGDETELARIFYEWGEEHRSRRLARMIVKRRPFTDTVELAEFIRRVVGSSGRHRHPATRAFQALRIAVNDELGSLQRGLEAVEHILGIGGRLVVIGFHSLEDRIVKHHLRRPGWQSLTKRVLRPSPEETAANPRARSAHLRAAIWQGSV